MERNNTVGIGGWMLIYVISSIPVLLFYAAGLSGWFFDYPIPLFLLILFLPRNLWVRSKSLFRAVGVVPADT